MLCSACPAEEKQTLRAEVMCNYPYKKLSKDIKVQPG